MMGRSIMETIKLNTPYTTLVSKLGTPVKEESDGGYRVLYFTSEAPTLADTYYLKNDQVEFVSISHYLKPVSLTEFTGAYGPPVYSVRKYSSGTEDSYNLVIHVWPDKGVAVTAVGKTDTAQVIREDHFAVMTKEEYLASWGKEYATHPQATMSSILVTQNPNQVGTKGIVNVEWVVVGIALFFVLVYTFRRYAKSRSSAT
jgi:hypothetical protein